MAERASSTLTRYRAAVATCVTLAAVGSVWYLLQSDARADQGIKSLRRSNAVRRSSAARRRRTARVVQNLVQGAEEPHVEDDASNEDPVHVSGSEESERPATRPQLGQLVGSVDGLYSPAEDYEDETEDDEDNEHEPLQADDSHTEHDIEENRGGGQGLEMLAYQLAKRNHDREGLIHHGVTCDECQAMPIKGPRYHCNNCPDFDLCEACEAKDCHLRTHVFTKIKIPAPWGGKDPQPVWYPGTPHKMPGTLDTPNTRALRNALSSKSGLGLNQIDGLWLQFSCMASVDPSYSGNSEDVSGFTIGRATFNQCFLAQITRGKAAAPNLIRDRLFALYDTGDKGAITFDDYVMGTALVHGTAPGFRRKRIFQGLDLDEDGYMSRKDCHLMLTSYYNLNRDVLLGYMEVDRFAENALVVQNGQDPRDHIAGGRSLASYFDSGFPGSERPPPWQTTFLGAKQIDGNGDNVPIDDTIPTTRRDHDYLDKLGPNEIAKGHHLKLNWLFHDEMIRLCASNQMRYLTQDQVRAFDESESMSDRTWFKWHRGDLWIADQAHQGRRAYFLVEPQDLEGEENWRQKLTDSNFFHRMHKKVNNRLMDIELWDAILTKGDQKILLREQRLKIGAEDSSPYPTPSLDNTNETDDDAVRSEADTFVGGSAASHTIYLAVRDALDELLDELFVLREKLAWRVAETADERQLHSAEVQKYLETLYERLWTANERRAASSDEAVDIVSSPTSREQAVRLYKATARRGSGKGAAMVSNYFLTQTFKGTWKELATDEYGWQCLYWAIEIDVGMLIEEEADESWRQKKVRRSSFVTARTSSDAATGLNRDPTMPQFMPNSTDGTMEEEDWEDVDSPPKVSSPTTKPARSSTSPSLTPQRLKHLALLEAVDRKYKTRGGAAKLSFEDFEVQLEKTNDKGEKLLGWMGGWIDLVNF